MGGAVALYVAVAGVHVSEGVQLRMHFADFLGQLCAAQRLAVPVVVQRAFGWAAQS